MINPPLLVAQVFSLGDQKDKHSQPGRYLPSAGAAGLSGDFAKTVAENVHFVVSSTLTGATETTARAELFTVKSLLFL